MISFLLLWLHGFLLAQPLPLDPSFGNLGAIVPNTETESEFGKNTPIALLPDGKILFVPHTESVFTLGRLSKDGRLDPTFGNGGLRNYQTFGSVPARTFANKLLVDGKNRIYLTGEDNTRSPSNAGYVVRLTAEGELDTGFGKEGHVALTFGIYTYIEDVMIEENGTLTIALFSFQELRQREGKSYIVRLLPDGGFDPAFAAKGVYEVQKPTTAPHSSRVAAIKRDPKGRYVVSGMYNCQYSVPGPSMVFRLLSNGQLDSSFHVSSSIPGYYFETQMQWEDWIYALTIGPDSSIYVGGSRNDYPASLHASMVFKLTPSGELDTSFASSSTVPGVFFYTFGKIPAWSSVVYLALDSQQRLVLAGAPRNGIANSLGMAIVRLSSDGVLDPSLFIEDQGLLVRGQTFLWQPDNKILVPSMSAKPDFRFMLYRLLL